MNVHIRVILRDLGVFLHVPGLMALVSLPICLIWGEFYAIVPFVATAGVALATGQLLYRSFRQAQSTQIYDAMLTVALSWGIIPLFGAIPLMAIATNIPPEVSSAIEVFQDPLNAIFEAFSGFTSAGLSVVAQPSQLPHSLQWWRSFMQWVGGVGVIVLAISLLEPSTEAYQLYSAEGRSQKIALTVGATVRKIWKIYLSYTGASILLFRILGMPWWEALNHGLSGISTGGFSIKDDSIGAYSLPIQIAVMVVMVAGAISFPIHARLWRERRPSVLWGNEQHCALWLLLGGGALLLSLVNLVWGDELIWSHSVFQWVSALSTCGFNTAKLSIWSEEAKFLLALAMVVGGTAGSTVGGVKLKRMVVLFRAILWRFERLALRPHQMMRYELDGEAISEIEASRQVEGAAVLLVLWLGMLLSGIFILQQVVPSQYTLSDTIFEAASALGSAGLSVGITTAELSWIGRSVEIFLMWMGRLEIVPVILLVSSLLYGSARIASRKTKSRKK